MTIREKAMASIIIPVYNCESYLGEAIESVLAQSYRPIEVIVVDDGSTDGSAGVARGFHLPELIYCHQPHGGASVARNRGAELAQGEYLAFLDSDDIWLPDKLSLQTAAFDRDPELDMVFGLVSQFQSPESGANRTENMKDSEKILRGYSVCTMMIKRESFFRVGPFSTKWRVGEFIDWHSKAAEKGLKSLMLSRVVLKRRIHRNNTGIRESHSQTDYVRILKAALDRRRKNRV